MEYVFPTYQQLVHLLPMDARITPPPDETMASSPKTADFPPSESSEATMSSAGPVTPFTSKPKPRRHSSFPSTSSRGDSKQTFFSASNILQAPPIESLYTQRSYLAIELQKQASRAASLVRQYVQADARHQTLEAGNDRRKLRKHLSLLKAKINEAVDQERVIFNRLGELYVEIQSRETWVMAGFQAQYLMDGSMPPTPSAYSSMSPISYEVTSPTTPLNASSPEFIPMSYFEDACRPSISRTETTYSEGTLETVEEEVELPPCSTTQYQCPGGYSGEVMETVEVEDGWAGARLKAASARRLSLPYIQAPWP
ncbi:hypothetical protein B0T10DRAFT_323957 [Thelonectria olida]|uniref:Uncharacterized protein n=1 Tax=Thelonectria olida TaxID=1576542 RepID=A0A9P8W974_9HYPO|nr:hypothetical protein B0T10DRAFT_323957 [Thelonectria olida]